MTRALLSTLLLLLALPPYASAQFSIPGFEDQLTITATPSLPGPNEFVHFSVEGAIFSSQNADASWSVNGKEVVPHEDGSIDVQMGRAGEKTVVIATVGSQTLTHTIIPTTVDLIVEGGGYTPPFFKGRPLASPGTVLRVQAIPHFGSAGVTIANDQIMFTWRQNGTVVASGKNRATATLSAPPLFGADTILVEARSQDGAYAGSASVRLPGIDPAATLYVHHPLVGIKYYDAVEEGESVEDVETTFAAVPYFADARSPSDPGLIYEWSVNGRAVRADAERASEITINADSASGVAQLSLTLSSSVNFFLHAEQSWNLRFLGTGSALPGGAPQSSSDSSIFRTGIQ
ncbi:MAG TPA: hypothetical protein VJK53_06055 [Candidatus Paceibacterota bacterium]